jgi:hypothetical protein
MTVPTARAEPTVTPDPGTATARAGRPVPRPRTTAPVRGPWIRAQGLNVTRHAAALRPFRADEFGTGAAAPSAGHLQAVNALMRQLRGELLRLSGRVDEEARRAVRQPDTRRLQALVSSKERAHT